MIRSFVAIFACITACNALIEELKDETFDKLVRDVNTGSWIVEFNKGPSKRLAELELISKALEGSGIRVGIVDTSSEKECSSGNVGLKLFGPDKKAPPASLATSTAKLDPATIIEKAMGKILEKVSGRLGKPKTSQKPKKKQTGGKPVELDDVTFEKTVMESDEAYMVAFVAPWCGHCKALAPEYEKAAIELENTGVIIATVDATANERLSQRFRIEGFPTIKFFPPGVANKMDDKVIDYQQERSTDAIVTWSLSQFEKYGGKVTVEIPEITSQSIFDDVCVENGKCIIVFVPDLLDTSAEGRNNLINEIKEAQRRTRHIKFAWIAAGHQPALEEAFHLSFGFPAVLYLRNHQGNELGLAMRGSTVNHSTLSSFASSAKSLGEFDQATWPAIRDVPAWDGEDAEPVIDDDDFDLDDFLNDA